MRTFAKKVQHDGPKDDMLAEK